MAARERNLTRVSEIVQVAMRHGFGYVFDRGRLRELVPWPHRVADAEPPRGSRGQRVRSMLDELGPSFVKFGQLLSTRPDIVPADVLAELRQLQDQAAPIPFSDIERVIVEELGAPIAELFADFDPVPVAAASIGQVHRATLLSGELVAVKVQRPNAEGQVEADIALLYQLARLAREHVRRLDFIDVVELVDEFARTIRHELDYRGEARNAELVRAAFADDPRVVVPAVHRGRSSQRVLTLDFLDGRLLREVGAEDSPEERARVGYAVAELWLEMVFRKGLFHGDPHPANILVLEDGRIGLVDFGVVERLSHDDVRRLMGLFVDAVAGRMEMLPRRLADLGVRVPRAQEDQLRADLEGLWARYAGASLGDVDPNELLRDLLALIHRRRLRLPSRFVLLDRTLITLGAVGQELNPQFNVFDLARPYAQELALSQLTPAALLARARTELTSSTQAFLDLPRDAAAVLDRLLRGDVEVGARLSGFERPMRRIDAMATRLVLAVVLASLLIGSSIVAAIPRGPHLLGLHVAAIPGLLAAAGVAFMLAVLTVRRGGH